MISPPPGQPILAYYWQHVNSYTILLHCPLAGSDSADPEQENVEVFQGFTQPAKFEDLVVSTQGATQSSQTQFQRLVKRMTRFWVTTDKEGTERELKNCLEREGCTTKVTEIAC